MEVKRIKFLLGPIKGFSPVERKLYSLSALCECSKRGTRHDDVKPDDSVTGINNGRPKTSSDSGKRCVDMSCTNSDVRTKYQSCDTSDQQGSMRLPISQHSGSELQLFTPKTNIPGILFQQTYLQWKSAQDLQFNIKKMRKKTVIYLQPLEVFPEFVNKFVFMFNNEVQTGFFRLLQEFLSVFFMGFRVKLMDTKLIAEYGWKVTSRYHSKTGEKQLLGSDIYTNMKKCIPADGFAMLGITWTDLYPTEELNFVLGEASSVNRAGVFCFGRFEPKAYVGDVPPPPITQITPLLIWRMLKLISHECCHIFGLAHCVYFECSMNESSSMAEALSQPMFLCPVCLRKMQKCSRFDILLRYEAMLDFFSEINEQYRCEYFESAISWLRKCICYIKNSNNIVNVSESTYL